MSVDFHNDVIFRETVIAKYLARKAGSDLAADFEAHYLGCEQCYEHLRAAQLLMIGLGLPSVERAHSHAVAVIRFPESARLVCASLDLTALAQTLIQKDTKVLIDLSTVSRIDSAGLGMLMNCYCHAVKNDGILKLLNPSAQVRKVLKMTKIDSVLQTFENETAALESFGQDG